MPLKYFRLLSKNTLCPVGLILLFGRLSWSPQGEKSCCEEVVWSAGHKGRVAAHGKEKGDSKGGTFGLSLREGSNAKLVGRKARTKEISAGLRAGHSACFWFAQNETEMALTFKRSFSTQKHPNHR